MDTLYIDIETRSRVDLRKFGVYPYVRCPDFRILIASFSTDGETMQRAEGTDEVLSIPGLRDSSVLKVAHNAQFERVSFSAAFGLPVGKFLDPEEWYDTQAVAAEQGWPSKLGNLGPALTGIEKDEAGTRLINLFCKPVASGKRKGQWNGPETHPLEWLDFMDYCDQDVFTLIDVYRALEARGGWPSDMERKAFMMDQRTNDRGIAIDMDLAQKAVVAGEKNMVVQKAEVTRLTELTGKRVENPKSVPQMRAWLDHMQIEAPNLRAETVEALLAEEDLQDEARQVLELRQELALAAPAKFSAALGAEHGDGRLRGTLKFFGAHTGRWAGRGTQLQNLPRAAFELEAEDLETVEMMLDLGIPKAQIDEFTAMRLDQITEDAISDLMVGAPTSSETLKKLVRPLFVGPFTVVDYSAIEARVLAWLAGEEWVLRAFREGRDIYVETADRMSTPERPLGRSQGKVAVLALGYNGAVASLRAMGASGTDEELVVLVKQWRKANPRIVQMWEWLGEAFHQGGPAGDLLSVTHSRDRLGRAAHLWLPSGRAITYHGISYDRYVVEDDEGNRIRKKSWRYANPSMPFHRSQRIGTYGGRLTENATQAVARDLMAEALVRLEEAGHQVVAHVHDEIIVQGTPDVDEISRIMCELPRWAEGLPVDGEGFQCTRYKKG